MRFRNTLLFVVLAVVWGSAFTAIKAGLSYFPPVLFAAFRYDLAGVLVLGYAAAATDRWRPRGRAEWIEVGIGGVLLIAAYHALLFVGEQGTTSAAGFLIYFDLLDRLGPIEINLVSYVAPVAAAVTGLVVLGETPTVYTVGGFLCIIVGFGLIKHRAIS